MTKKFFYMDTEKAGELLSRIEGINAEKQGTDSSVFLIDDFAVLYSDNMPNRSSAGS